MKKLFSFLLIGALLFSLAACADTWETEDAPTLRIGALKGPTGIGLVGLMDDDDYNFTLAGSADELVPRLLRGELELACLPANLASVLYHSSEGEIQVLAVNTLGVLYIVAHGDTVQSPDDLNGKTVYAAGKGATPEYTLRYILSKYNISANIEWKAEHTECLAALAQDENAVALLPQPFATAATMQLEDARIALDLNDLQTDGEELVTGCIAVRRDIADTFPDAIRDFLSDYEASVAFVNESPSDAAVLTEQHGIISAAVAEAAIPYCHIVCITGAEMKERLGAYLSLLAEQNPDAVGGALPDEDFYRFA